MTATPAIKIADAGERTAAFRRARVNSAVVRLMRVLLPVGAVLLLSSYALFMQRTIRVETKIHSGRINTGTVAASFDNLAMTNPSYEGYNKKDGSRFRVSAQKAITDLSREKPIELLEIDGSFQQRNGQLTAVKAKRGLFDQKHGTLDLAGGIRVTAPNGMRAALNSAKVDTKTSEITSTEPVFVEMPAGQVRSNAMRLNQRTREIEFRDGVATRLQPAARKTPTNGAGTEAEIGAGSVLGFGGGSNAPVDITSAMLAIAEKKRTAEFNGTVRASQAGRTLEAPKLHVSFDGGASLAGIAQAGDGTEDAPRGRLRKIVASNGVKLSQGDNEVRALEATFDVAAKKAVLSGGVKISAPVSRAINADHAAIDTETNRVVLTGNVVATQEKSLLRGNQMIYEPKLGRMQLASPAVRGAPRGSIFVRFHPPAPAGRHKRRGSTAAGGMAFSTNPDAPVEISARALDVQDPKSTARFDGNVHARQGDFVLTTPVLTAHYDGQIGLFSDPGTESRGKKQPPMKLRFIRATDPVHVSSGSDMKATGQRAEFDMVANLVTISGNVVLERGRQIVRGDTLVIDLKTGLSRMKNAAPERNARKPLVFGRAPQITTNPGQRACGGQMCAVIYPQDFQKEQAARKQRDAGGVRGRPRAPKLDSGWSTSTSTN